MADGDGKPVFVGFGIGRAEQVTKYLLMPWASLTEPAMYSRMGSSLIHGSHRSVR